MILFEQLALRELKSNKLQGSGGWEEERESTCLLPAEQRVVANTNHSYTSAPVDLMS